MDLWRKNMAINGSARGLALIGASNIAYCGMACFIRYAHDINAFSTTLFRFVVGLGVVGVLAMSGKIRLRFVDHKALFARGMIGSVSVFIAFLSIMKLGVMLASIILYTYPVFATIFGAVMLRERLSLIRGVSIAGALAGMVVLFTHGNVVTPAGGAGSFFILLSLCGAVLSGLTVVLIKRLQDTDTTPAIFFAQCLVGFWATIVPAGASPLHCGFEGGVLLVTIGLLAAAGQLFSTEGLRYVSVSSGSVCTLCAPVLNAAAGALLFHEALSAWSVAGGALVIASSALAARGEGRKRE
jgi:drug/metabolite transporter (DMT)-like permease